jgi:hypothetical protein
MRCQLNTSSTNQPFSPGFSLGMGWPGLAMFFSTPSRSTSTRPSHGPRITTAPLRA